MEKVGASWSRVCYQRGLPLLVLSDRNFIRSCFVIPLSKIDFKSLFLSNSPNEFNSLRLQIPDRGLLPPSHLLRTEDLVPLLQLQRKRASSRPVPCVRYLAPCSLNRTA